MRVIIADDDVQVRSALRLLLEYESDVEIVLETGSLTGILERMDDLRPDLLLLDWDMRLPVLNGAMIQTLRHHCPLMRILAMSGRPESHKQALQSGVDAFVSKAEPPERLLEALRAAIDPSFCFVSTAKMGDERTAKSPKNEV